MAQARYTINNESLRPRDVLLSGVKEIRRKLGNIGVTGGLHMNVHTRSRLYLELLVQSLDGSFKNEQDGTVLIASGAQSYSPTLREAWHRFKNRKNEMPLTERLKRFGQNVIEQRATKPSVHGSLRPLARVAHLADSSHFFGTFYPEELLPGQIYHDAAAPYKRAVVISPDAAEKLQIGNIFDFPAAVAQRGIEVLAFNTYHGVRYSQTGRTQLPDPLTFLSEFAAAGRIRQFTVGLNQSGLPKESGMEQEADTHVLTAELSQDEPDGEHVEALQKQMRAVLDNLPSEQSTIDITLSGKLWRASDEEMQKITHNVKWLAQSK